MNYQIELKVELMNKSVKLVVCLILGCFCLFDIALADSITEELDILKNRIAELEARQEVAEGKTDVLAGEVSDAKLSSIIPKKAELKSQYGLGPAASSVYKVKQGLSIGGYGEAIARKFVDDQGSNRDQADFLRAVIYLGYKFNDWIIFNSETEFEHATTSSIGGVSGDQSGSVSVEFAALDFLLDEKINIRAGILLMPLGFINEIHEAPYFHGVLRPVIETEIIPSTFRENGFGFFGKLTDELEYRTYLTSGLRASRFDSEGVRGGRQQGNRSLFEDFAWSARLDYTPNYIPGALIGGSILIGNAGQDEELAGERPSVRTTIADIHAEYRYKQFELRALGVWSEIGDSDLVSEETGEAVPSNQFGWYVQAAYNVLPLFAPESEQYLAPYVRFESFDLQRSVPNGLSANGSNNSDVVVVGLTYKPVDNVALKLDYRNFSSPGPNDSADELAVGLGYAF